MPTNAKNFQNKITIHLKIAKKLRFSFNGRHQKIHFKYKFDNKPGIAESE